MDTTTNDTLSHNQITLLNIQLKADIQAAYGNVRSHEVKLQGLTKQNSKLQQEIESIRNISYKEINEVRKLNERLQHNIKSLEEDLRKEKIQFDQRNEQLQEDIKTLEEHFRKEKTSSHKDKEQLMNRIRSIEDENNTLNATVLKLTSAYEDSTAVNKNLKETIASLHDDKFFLCSKLVDTEQTNTKNLLELQKYDKDVFFISSRMVDAEVANEKLLKLLCFMDMRLNCLVTTIEEKDSDIEYYQSKSNILIKQLAAEKARNINMEVEFEAFREDKGKREKLEEEDEEEEEEEEEEEKEEKEKELTAMGKKRKFVTFKDDALAEKIDNDDHVVDFPYDNGNSNNDDYDNDNYDNDHIDNHYGNYDYDEEESSPLNKFMRTYNGIV